MISVKKTNLLAMLACSAALVSSPAALAWDGAVAGYINGADVADGETYSFRIDLQGLPAMCGSTSNWAYVDKANPVFNVYVATLLAAKASGAQVTVYSTRDAGTGYCKIGYLRMTQ